MKAKQGNKKLSGGKLQGAKRLSDTAILKIQNYYGLAIYRNTNNLEGMRKAVWALFFHLLADDEYPNRGLCPIDDETLCKYNKSHKKGEVYEHAKHLHSQNLC